MLPTIYIYIHFHFLSYRCPGRQEPRTSFERYEKATDEQMARAKQCGIKGDRRRLVWKLARSGVDRTYEYGFKHARSAEDALQSAIADSMTLKGFEDLVAHWKTKECDKYVKEKGLDPVKSKLLESRRGQVVLHMFHESRTSGSGAASSSADVAPIEPKTAPKMAAPKKGPAHSGKQNDSTDKSHKLFELPAGKTDENHKIEECTGMVFRSSSGVQSEAERPSCRLEQIGENTEVVVPRIALVKFLEGLNILPSKANEYYGLVVGAYLEKGTHKGKLLIRSLFACDVESTSDFNESEERLWMGANSQMKLRGRLGCGQNY